MYINGYSKTSILFYLSILIGLFYFFTSIHPLYIFDTDDWINMAFGRKLYPSLEQFNPIKVFPETAFPFVSLISLKILYPLTNDFVGSLNIGYALLYSFAGRTHELNKKYFVIHGSKC